MKKQSLLILVLSLLGCTTPSQRFQQTATELGFDSELVKTSQFQHQIYLTRNMGKSKTLHVYLDGDGTPWERKRWVSYDPTARNPLVLRLMEQDNTPSILFGRPCYYGLNESDGCDSKYWTSHRYSTDIVLSMTNALNSWLKSHEFNRVVLIGYSGGGSLAVLMADKINHLKMLITVSANLDVKAWSEFHGYSTLQDSLNPIEQKKVSENIRQIHFAGKDDQVVPTFVIKNFVRIQHSAIYYEFEGQDHSCCWEDEWQNILNIMESL